MNPRDFSHRWLPGVVWRLDRLNQRHPWSHNDHFHRWILKNLPARRRLAADVGCGRGELVEKLARHFDRVLGSDRDAGMRAASSRVLAEHPNVSITPEELSDLRAGFDLITMVAVLHHLDADRALVEVRRLLAPGGRLMVVGLARPQTRLDWVWDVACLLSNPLIGLAKHPRPASSRRDSAPYPTLDPELSFADLRRIFDQHLPGARLRRRVGFRYTASWTNPDTPPEA